MAGYSIELGEGTDQHILNANFRFDLDFQLIPSGSGLADKIEVNIEAEGDVVGTTSAAVINDIVTLSEEVTEKAVARRVVIKLDGTTKYDFQESESFGTPLVTRFRVTTEDEGGESHLHWTMGIYVQLSGGGGEGGSAAINLRTSFAVRKQNENIIRKTWKASCQATSSDTAESIVRGFGPAEPDVIEEVEVFAQEAKATGIWVWEPKKSSQIIAIVESVEITGGGADYEGGPRVGDAAGIPPDPILHEKLRTAQTAIVRGTVFGKDKFLQPPDEHWQESDTMKRARGRETVYSTVPSGEDFLTTGIYKRQYEEIWIATGGVPEVNHGDHIDYVILEAPPTGKIRNR